MTDAAEHKAAAAAAEPTTETRPQAPVVPAAAPRVTWRAKSKPAVQRTPSGLGAVSVVICSHLAERWDRLRAAVQSIERQTIPVHEVVVVVDGDRDLAALAERHLADTCTLLTRDTPGGLSAARNLGLSAVSTPFVAFFDDDAEADEHWLERLMEPLADPDTLGVGGRSLPRWDAGEPAWFPPELLWAVGCSYAGLPDEIAPVRNVFGGCAVYRRELFDTNGGFRTDFGRHPGGAAGGEETEFCLRAAARSPGGRFVYNPAAVMHHHVPAGRATVRYLIRRSADEGRSKALLLAATHDGAPRHSAAPRRLATETTYLRGVVARGLLPELGGAPEEGLWSVARSAVLALSMLAAAWGFAAGLIGQLRRRHSNA